MNKASKPTARPAERIKASEKQSRKVGKTERRKQEKGRTAGVTAVGHVAPYDFTTNMNSRPSVRRGSWSASSLTIRGRIAVVLPPMWGLMKALSACHRG